MTWHQRLSWAGAALVTALVVAWAEAGGAWADSAPTPGTTVNVVQNGTGLNVCAPGASCTQRVDVLNVSIVIVVVGPPAAPARVTMAPARLDFGSIVLGHVSGTRAEVLTNRGGLPAVIVGIRVSGGTSAFTVDAGSCGAAGAAAVLAPAHSCRLTVRFNAAALGAQRADLLVNVDSTTLSAGLAGRGVVALRRVVVRAPAGPPAPASTGLPAPPDLAGAGPASVPAAAPPYPPPPPPIRHPLIQGPARLSEPAPTRASLSSMLRPPRTGVGSSGRTTAQRSALLGLVEWLALPILAGAIVFFAGHITARATEQRRYGLVVRG